MSTPTRAWLALAALSLPLVALSADLNGVAVLLPQIGRDLGASNGALGAVVSTAALGFAAPLILVGRLSDRVGARRLLLIGVVLFAASATVCAVAGDFSVLLIGRALQGIASACCFTTSLAVIDVIFDSDRRALAVGLWGAAGGIGGAIGPLVAGGLAAAWSWRAFFVVNIPFGLVSFVLLAVLVPTLPANRKLPLDVVRLGTLTLVVALVVGGLQHAAPGGWKSAGTLAPLLLGVAIGGVLVARGRGRPPFVPARVTRPASFRVGTWVATASNWGSGVVLVLVPASLQVVRHSTVLATGSLFLSFSAAYAIGGAISGPSSRRLGPRTAMAFGLATMAAGLGLLAIVGPAATLVALLAALAIAGLGNGVVYSVATSYALVDTQPADAGEASALLTMLRLLGLTLSVALSTSLLIWVDGLGLGLGSAGLRIALALGAAVTLAGVVPIVVRPAPDRTASQPVAAQE